jgi:alpha-ketoglutarate-dependent taurine dioxygenase
LRFKEACDRHTFGIPWQKGDVALLDNMKISHGRMPFEGDRRILVAMGGMCERDE